MAEIILGTLAIAAGVILLGVYLLELIATGVAGSKGVHLKRPGPWVPLIGAVLVIAGILTLFS